MRRKDTGPSSFRTQAAFRDWLEQHHQTRGELVVRLYRAHAAHLGLSYRQALDEALCFGWIDGVRRRFDADSFLVRFTPRKPGSIWSRINVAHAERLTTAGRMARAGLAAFRAREARRTGVYSFERKPMTLSPAFVRTFRANRKAWAYFQRAAPWYRRTSTYWVMSAKREETRATRLATLIDCCARGERVPPLKWA